MPWSEPATARRVPTRWLALSLVMAVAWIVAACVQGRPASDGGDPGFPFGPSSIGVQPLAYVPDIKPILDQDCLSCHSVRNPRGNYSVASYDDVMNDQRIGDASSSLVVDCAPGGSMYQYFSGDATTKATAIFRWMVYYNAAATR